MKTVTVREFRANLKYYLDNLPVTLVRSGEEIAIISDVYTTPKDTVYTKVYVAGDGTEFPDKQTLLLYEEETKPQTIDEREGNCGVQYCKYIGNVKKGVYTEWDGTLGEEMKLEMYMCPKHWRKYNANT